MRLWAARASVHRAAWGECPRRGGGLCWLCEKGTLPYSSQSSLCSHIWSWWVNVPQDSLSLTPLQTGLQKGPVSQARRLHVGAVQGPAGSTWNAPGCPLARLGPASSVLLGASLRLGGGRRGTALLLSWGVGKKKIISPGVARTCAGGHEAVAGTGSGRIKQLRVLERQKERCWYG